MKLKDQTMMNNISFIELIFFHAAYNDLVSIVGPLKERKFKGVTVDTYVAGEMKEFSSEELRVNKIIDHNSYYGVVFGEGRLSEKAFQNCLEDWKLRNSKSEY